MEENNTPEFDLQGFDAQYKTIKDMRKSLKTEIQNLDKEIVNLDENLTILEGEILQAKRNGDDQTRQAKIAERDKTKNDLAKKKVEVEAKKKVLEELNAKLQAKIEELQQQNPEVKEFVDAVMKEQRFTGIKRAEKQKAVLENEKKLVEEAKAKYEAQNAKIEVVKDMFAKKPELFNNMAEVFKSTDKINRLEEQKRSETDPAKIGQLEIQIRSERANLNTNLTPIKDYIKDKNIKVSDIMELANQGFEVDKNNNIDLNATLNKRSKENTEKIARLDKQIKNLDRGITKQDRLIAIHKAELQKMATRTRDSSSREEQEPQPKWWQFIKRFKNWNEKRKQASLPEPEPISFDRTPEERRAAREAIMKSQFRGSLIVEDIVNRDSKQIFKETQSEYYQSQQQDEHQEQEPPTEGDGR